MIKNEMGLTLIETVLTTFILSIGLLAVANMQIVAIKINTKSDRITKAMAITQDVIEDLMSVSFDDLEDDTPQGIFKTKSYEDFYHKSPPVGFRVRWEVDANPNDTKTVNVITTWRSAGRQKSLSLPLQRSRFQ